MKPPPCFCGSPTALRSGRYGKFYSCTRYPDCDGVVGVHPGTEFPLGTVGDQTTRDARRRAHEVFDALWRSAPTVSRGDAYRWLGEELGIDDPHMAEMDQDTAERVVELCEASDPEDLEEWLETVIDRWVG